MSYIGIIGAKRLDQYNPKLGLLEVYHKACELYRLGRGMYSIKTDTGWEMGIDGLWRYEVPDPFHTTEWIEDYMKRHFGEAINIRYCMHDTSLLVAYPEFARLRLFTLYSPIKRWLGYFSPVDYGMLVCMGTVGSPFEHQTEGILLHEVQHLIQEVEGFARGGNSSNYSIYQRLAGEVEARNICYRHALNLEERRSSLRTDTQDVPDKMQIIRFS